MKASFVLLKRGAKSLTAKLETVTEEKKFQIEIAQLKKISQKQIFPPPFWAS